MSNSVRFNAVNTAKVPPYLFCARHHVRYRDVEMTQTQDAVAAVWRRK